MCRHLWMLFVGCLYSKLPVRERVTKRGQFSSKRSVKSSFIKKKKANMFDSWALNCKQGDLNDTLQRLLFNQTDRKRHSESHGDNWEPVRADYGGRDHARMGARSKWGPAVKKRAMCFVELEGWLERSLGLRRNQNHQRENQGSRNWTAIWTSLCERAPRELCGSLAHYKMDVFRGVDGYWLG